jgi:XTP/dITP diphosphohydrolase/ATP diphosphatase
VFGDEASKAAGNASAGLETDGIDARQVLRNWEAIKLAEKRTANNGMEPDAIASRLGSIPRTMPALMEAVKLGSRAAKSGFDWPDAQGLFTKIEEETAELQEAIALSPVAPEPNATAIHDELGDLLFTVVNLARHLEVDPETALRQANTKFRRRFAEMEAESSLPLEELAADQLEELWRNAKEAEASTKQA